MINIDQIKREIKDATPHMLEALGMRHIKGRYWCPFCQTGDNHKTPDMTMHKATGSLKCHRCGEKTDVIGLYMKSRNVTFLSALEAMSKGKFKGASNYAKIAPKVAVEKPRKYYTSLGECEDALCYCMNGWKLVHSWSYHNETITKLVEFRFERNGEKSYRPVGYEEGKGWMIGRPSGLMPIYNFHAIMSDFDNAVTIHEGAKATDAATSIGLLATCCAGGANAADGTDWSVLKDRRIIIFPDNDEPGERFAADVKKHLPQATILRLDLPPKGDMFDWVKSRDGKTKEQMLAELREIWKEQR